MTISEYALLCNRKLDELCPLRDPDTDRVTEAMRYSLLAGGKRLRPYLTDAFCRMGGGDPRIALTFGCALEMVHTYSLIHDDLPAMDNDDLRRGRPTCHRAFDEATAILAGDALLTEAFSVISACEEASDRQRIAAVALLAEASGQRGMIGGQMMDIAAEGGKLPPEKLEKLQRGKTGALIRAACRLGCIAAGHLDGSLTEAADAYASALGLAFQIVDDVLDATGDEAKLGKPIGSDEKEGKVTFYTLLGDREARAYAARLTDAACAAVAGLADSEPLVSLARGMLLRDR